uniref:Copper transport protein n=1 Tax=Acrobeloides nanus TaxID=290746 RepID=A0A914DYR1_9BILA
MDMSMNMPGGGYSYTTDMKHNMWMFFHTSIGETVLFDFWTVNSVEDMILSCAVVFLMGLCFEGIKFLRWRVGVSKALTPPTSMTMRYVDKLRSSHHLIQTFLFGIQIVVSYLLMLVFMTFSIWLGLAISLGIAFGYYLFGTRHDSDMVGTRHDSDQKYQVTIN